MYGGSIVLYIVAGIFGLLTIVPGTVGLVKVIRASPSKPNPKISTSFMNPSFRKKTTTISFANEATHSLL